MWKKLDGGVIPTAPEPVPEHLRIFAWEDDLIPPVKKNALPENIKLIGHIPVDKLVVRAKKVKDPLLGIVKPWKQDQYDSTTWTKEAYTNMFDKFFYNVPADFINLEPEISKLADAVTLQEHEYMQNSIVTPIVLTKKNVDSTPAYPKFQEYESEEEYLEKHGWNEYIEAFQNVDETVKHRPLWWCFLKNEVLKKKKIEDNDIRMILCTDPVFTRIGASFEQDQNERMKTKTETHSAQVGWTPFFGGLDARIRRLMKVGDPTFVEMDWTRYDGTIPKKLFYRIKQMRFFFLKKEFQTPKNEKLYDWYIKNLLEKLILLPTGEVCEVKKGNPSGQFSTTVDNNMVNVWLTTFEFAYLHYQQKGRVPTVQEMTENVKFICYGDDRLLAYKTGFVEYDAVTVIDMYKHLFGMWVKPENVKISKTPVGLSFCGLTIVQKEGGQYVGVPNVDKILSTLENPTKKLPDIQSLWGKLISLRLLCENAPTDVKQFLDEQIDAVVEFASHEGIELPEVGPDFFAKIW